MFFLEWECHVTPQIPCLVSFHVSSTIRKKRSRIYFRLGWFSYSLSLSFSLNHAHTHIYNESVATETHNAIRAFSFFLPSMHILGAADVKRPTRIAVSGSLKGFLFLSSSLPQLLIPSSCVVVLPFSWLLLLCLKIHSYKIRFWDILSGSRQSMGNIGRRIGLTKCDQQSILK